MKMKISSAWTRHVVNGLALLTGAATFTYEVTDERKKAWAAKAYETSFHPSTPWDYNWDKREPESLINPADENQSKECLAKVKSHSNRHIFLIRHGQYNLDGATDEERYLTPLGREQAEATGQRLHDLGFPYNFIVRSTMTRAVETGKIISKHITSVPIKNCDMIREGAPIPPEPPVGHWKPEAKQFFEDGARIEAAFRHYFHRALPEQEKDSYEIYVCHANVIRYLVCRAMQFPPEAWLRFSLHHCSITWLTIRPSGRVILRTLGDTGHIAPDKMTTS